MAAVALLLFSAPPLHAETLTLREAIERALRFAPAMDVSLAAADLSDAQTREARAALMPALSARSEYSQSPGYDTVVTNRGLSSATLELDYTAIDFGRRMSLVRASRFAAEAAQLGVAGARAQVVFETTVAYADLMRAKRVALENQANLERLSRYVDTIDRLLSGGRAIENDSLKVRAARDAAELAFSDAQNDRLHASMVLGALIGDFTRNDFDIADRAELPPMPSGQLRETPALRAALREVDSAKMAVQAVQAERYPTLQLAVTAGALGVDPRSTIEQHYGASYDGVLSMPIFDGGLIAAHIDEAKAKQRQAEAQARSIEIMLQRQLDEARLSHQRALDQLTILGRAQPDADDAFALTWTRFLGGSTATLLEVLDAYEQAESLRVSRIQQDFAAREAVAEAALLYGVSQ